MLSFFFYLFVFVKQMRNILFKNITSHDIIKGTSLCYAKATKLIINKHYWNNLIKLIDVSEM